MRGLGFILVVVVLAIDVAPRVLPWQARASAQAFVEEAPLAPDGASTDDTYGRGLACDGQTILVGSPHEVTAAGDDVGAAYAYSGEGFSDVQRIVPSVAEEYDSFGGAIAVDGDHAIFGTTRIQSGKVHVFERVDGMWTEQQVIDPTGPARDASFGRDVLIQGETAFVTAPKEAGDTGAVYVYGLVDGEWTEQQQLRASDAMAGDFFGLSIALDGDTVAVGAPGNLLYPDERAAVYLFTRAGDTWSEAGRVTFQGEGGPGEGGGGFGGQVALDGDTLAVAARAGMDEAANYGLQIFRGGGASWTLETTLMLPDEESMGSPVRLQGDALWTLGTTAGVRSVYQFVRDGSTWSEGTRLASSDGAATVGMLEVCGGTLLFRTSNEAGTRSVRVFRDPVLDAALPGGGESGGGDGGDDGGCSVAGSPAGLTWGGLAVALLALRRRRRPREARQ